MNTMQAILTADGISQRAGSTRAGGGQGQGRRRRQPQADRDHVMDVLMQQSCFQGLEKSAVIFSKPWKNQQSAVPSLGKQE